MGLSLTITPFALIRFAPTHRSADGGIVHAEMIRDFLHGVNTGAKSTCHRFASDGKSLLVVSYRLREGATLRPWDFAQHVQRPGASGEALDERIATDAF